MTWFTLKGHGIMLCSKECNCGSLTVSSSMLQRMHLWPPFYFFSLRFRPRLDSVLNKPIKKSFKCQSLKAIKKIHHEAKMPPGHRHICHCPSTISDSATPTGARDTTEARRSARARTQCTTGRKVRTNATERKHVGAPNRKQTSCTRSRHPCYLGAYTTDGRTAAGGQGPVLLLVLGTAEVQVQARLRRDATRRDKRHGSAAARLVLSCVHLLVVVGAAAAGISSFYSLVYF